MEVLDASMLEDWNLVMVERHVPYDMVLEVLEEEKVSPHDLTDNEINNLISIPRDTLGFSFIKRK